MRGLGRDPFRPQVLGDFTFRGLVVTVLVSVAAWLGFMG